MSQPHQPTPSQSPTPSKSSLRRTSGAQNPSQRSLIPPPSPRFEDQPAVPVRYSPRSPPNQTLEYESDEDDEPLIYPDPPPVSGGDSYFPYPEPERPFQPLFTLIEDGLTSEHHHPSVHYIFADDDTELITEAALRSIEQDNFGASSTADNGASNTITDQPGINIRNDARLPLPNPNILEHYLVLDIQPISPVEAQAHAQVQAQAQRQSTHANPPTPTHTHAQSQSQPEFLPSYTVTSFTSFSPDWQISSASITSAPTMGDTPNEEEALMLRIEGRGVAAPDDLELPGERAGKAPSAGQAQGGTDDMRATQSLEEMIEKFQSRLGEVKRLIDTEGGGSGRGDTVGGDTGYREGERMGFGLEEQD